MSPHPALMTLAEVSRYLRLDPRSVVALIDEGLLSGKKIRGRWRISRASVVAYAPQSTPTRPVTPQPSRVGATT